MITFFKEKGFTILLLSFIFTLGSLFWFWGDIAYSQSDLSSLEFGWPMHFITQDQSQLDPPAWWFPHRLGFGAAQEFSIKSFQFLPFAIDIIFNFIIIFSIVFIVLKFNPRLVFLRKIISVKYILGVIGAALIIFISLIYISVPPQINIEKVNMENPLPEIPLSQSSGYGSFEQKLAACKAIPHGSTQTIAETTRLFVNIPKDIYPEKENNLKFSTVSGNAMAGYVSNGGLPGEAFEASSECWSYYVEFNGNGEVDLTVKSVINGMPDYLVHFIIGTVE